MHVLLIEHLALIPEIMGFDVSEISEALTNNLQAERRNHLNVFLKSFCGDCAADYLCGP